MYQQDEEIHVANFAIAYTLDSPHKITTRLSLVQLRAQINNTNIMVKIKRTPWIRSRHRMSSV